MAAIAFCGGHGRDIGTSRHRAKWTDAIHEEWIRNVLQDRPDLNPEQPYRTRDLMNAHVRDCLETGYETLIDAVTLPDKGRPTCSGCRDPRRCRPHRHIQSQGFSFTRLEALRHRSPASRRLPDVSTRHGAKYCLCCRQAAQGKPQEPSKERGGISHHPGSSGADSNGVVSAEIRRIDLS